MSYCGGTEKSPPMCLSSSVNKSQPKTHLCTWKRRCYRASWRNYKGKNRFKKLRGATLIRHVLLLIVSFSPAAFERGHCYEPYLQNGNFTTSDPLYGVGAVVQFTCDPGHSLEQGPPVIECISARDPYWNDTEPLCKGNTDGRK